MPAAKRKAPARKSAQQREIERQARKHPDPPVLPEPADLPAAVLEQARERYELTNADRLAIARRQLLGLQGQRYEHELDLRRLQSLPQDLRDGGVDEVLARADRAIKLCDHGIQCTLGEIARLDQA